MNNYYWIQEFDVIRIKGKATFKIDDSLNEEKEKLFLKWLYQFEDFIYCTESNINYSRKYNFQINKDLLLKELIDCKEYVISRKSDFEMYTKDKIRYIYSEYNSNKADKILSVYDYLIFKIDNLIGGLSNVCKD